MFVSVDMFTIVNSWFDVINTIEISKEIESISKNNKLYKCSILKTENIQYHHS